MKRCIKDTSEKSNITCSKLGPDNLCGPFKTVEKMCEDMYNRTLLEDLSYFDRFSDGVFAMSKLSAKYADTRITGPIDKFIYFSASMHPAGPRIKFYGGTSETDTTDTGPTYTFTKNGPGHHELQPWMNKKNCPNAFDKDKLNMVRDFISNNLSILLLVWYKRIDEADALKYFEGAMPLKELIAPLGEKFATCNSRDKLHSACLAGNLYTYPNR